MRSLISHVASFVHAQIDARDLVFVVGLLLLAAGLYLIFAPAALVVPGAILTYVALFTTAPKADD